MDEDRKCKNLLIEQTCEECKFEDDDFCIKHIQKFPYKIPKFHNILLVEKKNENSISVVTVYIKDGKVLIKAEDYDCNAIYLIHMRYIKCDFKNTPIPPEMTCEYFACK